MSWTYEAAQQRVNKLKGTVPNVVIERFDETYLAKRRSLLVESAVTTGSRDRPLFRLSNQEAVIVDGVHIYINLLNFDGYLIDNSKESEHSHARALQFLHLHYNACDRAVEDAGAQRVDFHGSRLHAIVIEPPGPQNAPERVRRALSLAQSIRELGDRASVEFGGMLFAQYRIGIDSGVCVAISSGRGSEPEPLFLGNAANYAAKLAEGDDAGVFVSDAVRALISADLIEGRNVSFDRFLEERATYNATDLRDVGLSPTLVTDKMLAQWRDEIASGLTKAAASEHFQFHYHAPPLNSIDYAKLMPSNSIRMPMISVFADISGFTDYIETAMTSVNGPADAVRNLHVIRGELAAVLRDDFHGKKVRFIGDCLHGLFAWGSSTSVDEAETVDRAIHVVGAIRSSFLVCRNSLSGIHNLGIAIGFELGHTPVSRIGVRGDRSVRVSISRATAMAESLQSVSNGETTAIGPAALAAASPAARLLFSSAMLPNLIYDVAEGLVPLKSIASPSTSAQPTEPKLRAYV